MQIQDHHIGRVPPFENIFGFDFINVDGNTCNYYICSQHTMCTIRISFSTRNAKTCMCEKVSKQSPVPKNSTMLGLAAGL